MAFLDHLLNKKAISCRVVYLPFFVRENIDEDVEIEWKMSEKNSLGRYLAISETSQLLHAIKIAISQTAEGNICNTNVTSFPRGEHSYRHSPRVVGYLFC